MPASGHKILVHAADIVSGAILLTRQLSEDAQESRNKNQDGTDFRPHPARKLSAKLYDI